MIPGHHNYRHLVQFVLITSQDMAQVWLVLAELLLFLIKVVQGPVDSTVSAVVGTSAVVRCPNTAMSSLILVVWKIRPKNGTRCTLAYRADTNKTGGINCSERVTWDSSPNHEAALQIHPVRLTDEGIYICEIGTSDGTFCQVSALTVLVPPLVTLTRDSNGVVVCQASAGKPAAEISWVPENGHSIENKTHHTNGTVTLLSSVSWINSTSDHVTCLVTHPAMNQTQTIELSPQPSADVTFPPMLYYFLIIASSGVAVAVVVLILYWTLKCRASRLSGLADDATVPNTTGSNLRLTSRPRTVNTTNSSTTESIYQNYSVQNMQNNVNYVTIQKERDKS
ncbi:cell surface glycoprotein CD200 receptor 1-B-like isoform X4 [Emydura macquarii macquarii]|uniref:cell surface glycoprotein CD200 receptor 1-B-like isoform X4 n=1 Tax=Emydura macquarii macquarii TaxID=1129001 RepID=UPI00352A2DA2